MSDRTFIVKTPHMRGTDVRDWQQQVKAQFKSMKIDCPIQIDGDYGPASRSYTASLCFALGMTPKRVMADGVTPKLRTTIREGKFTKAQLEARKKRAYYRKKLRDRWNIRVHPPVNQILADSWGYHPGVHDGVDVICPADAIVFAMVKCKVIDVRSSGWWGLGAPTDPNVRAKGDGIIQVQVLESIGPFVKGDHIGYGHAEKATVKVGDVVEAGKPLGRAGLANAWHVHLMLNNGSTSKGIGNKDPQKILDYSVKNG